MCHMYMLGEGLVVAQVKYRASNQETGIHVILFLDGAVWLGLGNTTTRLARVRATQLLGEL